MTRFYSSLKWDFFCHCESNRGAKTQPGQHSVTWVGTSSPQRLTRLYVLVSTPVLVFFPFCASLPVCLSVCLSVCFSVCLVWLSVRVSLHQTVLIFDFLFVCPLKFELVCLSGWLYTCSRWFGRLVPLGRRLYINGQFIWLLSAVRSLENKQLPSPLECYRKNTRFKTIHYQHSSFSLIPIFPKEKPNVR